MKYFSLINGSFVAPSGKSKIVKESEFCQLLEARDVLEEATSQSEKHLEEARAECEAIRRRAYEEGFQKGLDEWVAQVKNLEEEIAKVHEEVEKLALPIALQAAKKIVAREIELSRETIVDIVKNSLKNVLDHKKVTVYVHQSDLECVEEKKDELRSLFEKLESLSIQERADIEPGGCIIETEVGIVNSQLSNQWNMLEQAFQKMMITKTAEADE